MTSLETLISLLAKLPGVGPKSAQRIAYHLIGSKSDQAFNKMLGEHISIIKEKVFPCPVCGGFTETSPCEICCDPSRDQSQLCIVEQPQDVATIIHSGAGYHGLFFVLGGAISPLDGIGPDDLHFGKLMKRIAEGKIKEVILATNPTDEGETTALYIGRLLKDHPEIAVTRLARGLPYGGDLEYVDHQTLARSLEKRVRLN